jgi:hypothetical protein
VLRDIGLEYIPKRTIRLQKYYMKRGLYMGLNTNVQKFVERLNDLNRYLLYFPEVYPKQFDQDEIIKILDQDKAPEWHEAMKNAKLTFLKCLMKNLFLISSIWKTWRISGAPMVQILLHYQ